jgi:SNF2 family DNA or RNA helicase
MSIKWNPHQYQVSAAQHALYHPGSALFLEPGLGKTAISLAVVKVLKKEKMIGGTLVIAPLRVCHSVWPKEAKKWSDFEGLSLGILHGTPKQRAAVLAQNHDVYVINPDGLKWLFETALANGQAWPFDNLIVDESTKFKDTTTLRFKLLKKVLGRFKRRLLLTGTPSPNGLENLFGQVYLIDSGARLGSYITAYRREYFDEHRHPVLGFSNWLPRRDTEARIRERIKDVCLYMSAEDHLKMPERIDNVIKVDLPEAVRKTYRQVEKDFFSSLDTERSISAAHAAAAGMKLRQITGGACYDDIHAANALHDVKLNALMDLIDEASGQPMLVAVAFQHEADRIKALLAKHYQIDAPYLGGGISPQATDKVVNAWNAGKLPVVLAHPTSVAHGLNLQAGGHVVVWFSLTWNLEEYDQFNRRVYRQGQDKGVIIHHLLASNTIDETVYEALASKDQSQKSLLAALKRRKDTNAV